MALKKSLEGQMQESLSGKKAKEVFSQTGKEKKVLTTFSIEPSFKRELEELFDDMGLGWAGGIRFALKEFAKKMNIEVWFSVSPVRPDVVYDEHGVPNTLVKYFDLIDVLIALRYDDKIDKVVMTVVRSHHANVPKPMQVNLDPKTMLISK